MIRKSLLAIALLGLSAGTPALAASISPAGLGAALASDPAVAPLVEVHGSHGNCAWGPARGWWHRHTSNGARACTPSRRFDDGDVVRRNDNVRRYGRDHRRYEPNGSIVILDPPTSYHPVRPARPYVADDYYGYDHGYDRNRHNHSQDYGHSDYGSYGSVVTPQNCAKDWHCKKSGPFGLKKTCGWRLLCN